MRESTGPGPAGFGPCGYGSDAGGCRPSRGRSARRLLSHLAVAVAAAGAAVGVTLAVSPAGTSAGTSPSGPDAVPSPAAPPAGRTVAADSEQQIVNKVRPGLVVINTTLHYSGDAAAGTGMVINPSGLVLTNNHVIEGSTTITATVAATGKTYPAIVVGYDKAADIALIRLRGASGLKIVPVGDSAAVTAGEPAVALGNAGGRGAIVPAAGQVTALNVTVTATDRELASSETLNGMIKADASIIPGDSGGPLVGPAGQVIGIDTAGDGASATQQQPAGYAIPVNTALSVASQIAAGHAGPAVSICYPPFLGVFIGSGTSSSPQTQARQQEQQNVFAGTGTAPACYTSDNGLEMPSAIAPVSSGTLTEGTICGGPAASAGLTGGSVITAVNGQPTGQPAQLRGVLSRFRPGDAISVTWVSPAGRQATSRLRLTAGPPQ